MHNTVTIEEIDTKFLSAKSLALISEFALTLYRLNGMMLRVDDEDVLIQISALAKELKDADDGLHCVYKRLRAELQKNFLRSLPPSSAHVMHRLMSDDNALREIAKHSLHVTAA